jgi:hypothetical protein
MHPDADRSQAVGNPLPRRTRGQQALIGGALVVLAITAAMLGSSLLSPDEDAATAARAGDSLEFEGFASSSKGGVTNQAERIDALSAELSGLRRELEVERRARRALEKQLVDLNARVGTQASEESAYGSTPMRGRPGDSGNRSADSKMSAASIAKKKNTPPRDSNQEDQPWFNRLSLERTGMSSSQIDEVVERWERHEMDKLYFDDESRRDGSFKTPGYNQELVGMDQELRTDLGVEGYDAYLYATGQNNRAVVGQVIQNSPAGRAGVQAGDMVISYSGERVFRPRELKRATTSSQLGSQVYIEVLRDGKMLRFSVPSGPLGISLKPISAPPSGDR